MVFLEGVGDVFEEDEAEDDVLVFRRVHVVAELVGGEPELGLKADVGGVVFFGGTSSGHAIEAVLYRTRGIQGRRKWLIASSHCFSESRSCRRGPSFLRQEVVAKRWLQVDHRDKPPLARKLAGEILNL